VVNLSTEIDEQPETVFHKKLKVMMKEKGDEGRIAFLEDYLDYLLRGKKTLGLDERKGWIHIRIWHKDSELVEFARSRGYEFKIEHYD
jgi:hypothetical protein